MVRARKEQLNILRAYWFTDVISVTAVGFVTFSAFPDATDRPTITDTPDGNANIGSLVRGIVTAGDFNFVKIRNNTTKAGIIDTNGNIIFGRLTYSASNYRIDFKTFVAGAEQSTSMPDAYDIEVLFPEVINVFEIPPYATLVPEGDWGYGATGTGGGPGGENLQDTLTIGNFTGPEQKIIFRPLASGVSDFAINNTTSLGLVADFEDTAINAVGKAISITGQILDAGSVSGKGGDLNLFAGDSLANGLAGGNLSIGAGGSPTISGSGGSATISSGSSSIGGNVTIESGDGSTGNAGNINIISGKSTSAQDGYIEFKTGTFDFLRMFNSNIQFDDAKGNDHPYYGIASTDASPEFTLLRGSRIHFDDTSRSDGYSLVVQAQNSQSAGGNILLEAGRNLTSTGTRPGGFYGAGASGSAAGQVKMVAGFTDAVSGTGGEVVIKAGNAENGSAGDLSLELGESTGGTNSGSLFILGKNSPPNGTPTYISMTMGARDAIADTSQIADGGGILQHFWTISTGGGANNLAHLGSTTNDGYGEDHLLYKHDADINHVLMHADATTDDNYELVIKGQLKNSSSSSSYGGAVKILGGNRTGTNGIGGELLLRAGNVEDTGIGGSTFVYAGNGTGTNSTGGSLTIKGGNGQLAAGVTSIQGGNTTASTSNRGGDIYINGGSSTASGTGYAYLQTLNSLADTYPSGNIYIETGDGPSGGTGDSGDIEITTGTAQNTGDSGDITIGTGAGGSDGAGGTINLTGGQGNGSGNGGTITLNGGRIDSAVGTGSGGTINILGGLGGLAGNCGAINILGSSQITSSKANGITITSSTSAGSGDGGDVAITSGPNTATGNNGDVIISTPDKTGTAGTAGDVDISAGEGSVANTTGGNVDISSGGCGAAGNDTGDVTITGGESSNASVIGGDISITGGASSGTGGTVTILSGLGDTSNGNVIIGTQSASGTSGELRFQVDGTNRVRITDSEGVILTAISTPVATPSAGTGYLFVDSADGALKYKGSSGTISTIAPA